MVAPGSVFQLRISSLGFGVSVLGSESDLPPRSDPMRDLIQFLAPFRARVLLCWPGLLWWPRHLLANLGLDIC